MSRMAFTTSPASLFADCAGSTKAAPFSAGTDGSAGIAEKPIGGAPPPTIAPSDMRAANRIKTRA